MVVVVIHIYICFFYDYIYHVMYTTFMYLDDDGSSEHILYYVLTHFVHIIHTVGEKVHGDVWK